MKRHWVKVYFSAALIMAALATPILAQGGPGMMGREGPDYRWGHHMWDGGGPGGWWDHGPEGMLDRIEGRLAFIKAELKITEAQMPQWNKLADAIRTSAKSMKDRMQAMMAGDKPAGTLLEHLERREQLMTARLEEIKQVKGALKDLYASLTEEQKKEADNLVLPMMGMGPGMSMGMGMGPGMMGWGR